MFRGAPDDWPRLPGATRSRFSAGLPTEIDTDTSLSDYRDVLVWMAVCVCVCVFVGVTVIADHRMDLI